MCVGKTARHNLNVHQGSFSIEGAKSSLPRFLYAVLAPYEAQ